MADNTYFSSLLINYKVSEYSDNVKRIYSWDGSLYTDKFNSILFAIKVLHFEVLIEKVIAK